VSTTPVRKLPIATQGFTVGGPLED
jgi:hypothetical protein